jgi:uncharacterized protein (TIGR04255 family)
VENHEPWRNPPLVEAIFEIRFPSVSDYALFAGGMAISQQQEFPTTQKLQTVEIPEVIEISGLVKHRFISIDGGLLFQTGVDVLSVNSITYKGFADFLKNINKILNATERFVNLSTLTRLDLRYINKFNNVDRPPSVLNINLPFKTTNVTETKFLKLQEVTIIEDDNLIGINVEFPINLNDLILDIDISLNSSQENWDIAMISAWTEKAHDLIWDKFQSLISQTEKEARI